MSTHEAVPRTEMSRLREKASTDVAALHALLESALVAHVGLVADDHPVVLPVAFALHDGGLVVHGSTGSRWMRLLAEGAPACVSVTAVDGLVVARSTFESSLHYRSAVAFGRFTAVTGPEKQRALDRIVERLIPGRLDETRPSTKREVAATLVLAMPLDRWSLKVSDGWPEDTAEDVAGPAWAGVLPLGTRYGAPQPAPDLREGIPVPPSVQRLSGT